MNVEDSSSCGDEDKIAITRLLALIVTFFLIVLQVLPPPFKKKKQNSVLEARETSL